MKKGKTFQKGKHIYTKVGQLKEVITLRKAPELQYEFSDDCDELYVDNYSFSVKDNKIQLYFYKQIPGSAEHKLKKIITLDPKTAKRFFSLLKNSLLK